MNFNFENINIPLWENEIPNYQEFGEENITEVVDDNANYTLIAKPEISVFKPSKINSTEQAVLVIPGGGYIGVSYVLEGYDIAKWLNSFGITAIVLKYRLPHAKSNIVKHKSPLIDASRAMKIIRVNAQNWGINANNVGVMGFSAGGHLASTLGTHFHSKEYIAKDKIDSLSDRPDFIILMYPVISMSEKFTHEGSRHFLLGDDASDELKDYYSSEKNVTKETPPTFLVHASDDMVVDVDNSIVFYQKLRQNKVYAEMHIFNKGGHAFALANREGLPNQWRNLCIDWLKAL